MAWQSVPIWQVSFHFRFLTMGKQIHEHKSEITPDDHGVSYHLSVP